MSIHPSGSAIASSFTRLSGAYRSTKRREAVTAAEDGDEILVKRGTYTGPIDITGDIVLRGEDREAVIVEFGYGCTEDELTETTTCPDEAWLYSGFDSDPWPYGISMIETEAKLSDLTIRKSPDVGGSGFVVKGGAPHISRVTYTGESDFGNVLVHGGSRAIISESEFGPMWVFFEEESPATIENSTVEGTIRLHTNSAPPADEPQVVRGNAAVAIMLRGNAVVTDNVMDQAQIHEDDRARTAIDVDNGEFLISGNEISLYLTGIMVNGPSSATIQDNILTDNGTAIVDGATSDQIIDGNTVSGGGGGIFVTGSGSSTLSQNTISGLSRRAIGINGSGSALVSGNHACGNGVDLYVSPSSETVIEDDNEFCVIAPAE